MKKILSLLVALMSYVSLPAQNVKNGEPSADDVLMLLRAMGYDLYTFDLTDFLKDDYEVSFSIKEYDKRGEIDPDCNTIWIAGPNKIRISQLSAEERQQAVELGLTKGMKRGVVHKIDKVNIAMLPTQQESAMKINAMFGRVGSYSEVLNLRPISKDDGSCKQYKYSTRPFLIDSFEDGKFIPLLALLSWWYDDEADAFRQCGASKLKADLSDEILQNVPHYYVIGIILEKIESEKR